jgi:hypothetical protein
MIYKQSKRPVSCLCSLVRVHASALYCNLTFMFLELKSREDEATRVLSSKRSRKVRSEY